MSHAHHGCTDIYYVLCCRVQSVDDVAMATPLCSKSDEDGCKPKAPPVVVPVVSTSPPSSGAITPVSVVTGLFILLCAVLVVVLVIVVILFLRARNSRSSVSINDRFGTVESGNETEKQAGNQNGNQTGKQNENRGDNHYENVDPEKDNVISNIATQENV